MGEILFQSSYALLTYQKNDKLLLLEWKSSCTDDEYRNTFNEAFKIADKNNVKFFLSDLREEGPVTYVNLLWLRDEIIPKAIRLGIQKIGLIFEERFYTRIYADTIRASLEKSNIPINYFTNKEDAEIWFQS